MKTRYFIKKLALHLQEDASFFKRSAIRWSFICILAASLFGFFMVMAEVGFNSDYSLRESYNQKIVYILNFLMLMYAIQVSMIFFPGKPTITRTNLIIKIFLLVLLSLHFFKPFPDNVVFVVNSGYYLEWLFNYALITVVMLRSWSRVIGNIYKYLSGEKIFVFSFAFLILLGALLLLLPESTYKPISFTDALFTSTSAVCVTGLTVFNISAEFTWFGKLIILFLIQLGGIGVMTFTSFLAMAGRANSSMFESSALNSMFVASNMKKLFSALYVVIIVTIVIEILGAILIYFMLPHDFFADDISKIAFSVFHAVSAFCNAGFSTVQDGMMNPIFQNRWDVQITIAFLIIFGGLGFFIIANYIERFSLGLKNLFRIILGKDKIYKPHLININSRIVVKTTFLLIVLGTAFFMFFEDDGILRGMSWDEKFYTSFFSTVTSRTAGFNTIDYGSIMMPATMLIIFLMWVGASPGSTGGGIKTTTFTIAFLTAFSLGRGKKTTHYRNRELSRQSGRKALVVIFFSISLLFISTMFLAYFEPNISLDKLMFEAFSAFGTVGLSKNLTPFLHEGSKYILIGLMFVGRIGIITIFISFVRKTRFLLFSFPEEEIFI